MPWHLVLQPFALVLLVPGVVTAYMAAYAAWGRQLKPRPRTLVITGNLAPDLAQQLAALGADAFLHEPFTLGRLLPVLGELLGGGTRSASGPISVPLEE